MMDVILYPGLDRNLTTNQVGEFFSKFQNVKKEFGDGPQNHETFIMSLN